MPNLCFNMEKAVPIRKATCFLAGRKRNSLNTINSINLFTK